MSRTVIQRSGITLANLAKDIADQLAATGHWQKDVDQSATGGHVIMSPTQTFQYRTSTAARIDNGGTWEADGKPYRYEYPSAFGEERFYMKLTPHYNSSGNWRGYYMQAANELNGAADDLYYDNGGTGGTKDYKLSDGSVVTSSPHTTTYPHRIITSKRGVSPANSSQNYYPQVSPFSTYYDKDTTTVSYMLVVYHTQDVANPENREDYVLGICWGENTSTGYTRTFEFGVPRALAAWFGQNFGGCRGGYASSDCYGTGDNSGGWKMLGHAWTSFPNMPGTQHEWNSHTMSAYSGSASYISSVKSNIDGRAGMRLFDSAPTNPAGDTWGHASQYATREVYDLRATGSGVHTMVRGRHWICPHYTRYYNLGSSSNSNNAYLSDPIAELPWGDDVYAMHPQGANSLFGQSIRTGDRVEYDGRRYLVVRNTNTSLGSNSSYQNFCLVYIEDVV